MPARRRAAGSSQQPIPIDDSDDEVPPIRSNHAQSSPVDSDDSSVIAAETFRRRHAQANNGRGKQAEPPIPASQAPSGGPRVRSARKTINSRRPGPSHQDAQSSEEEEEHQTPRARLRGRHAGQSSISNPASASTSPIKTPKPQPLRRARIQAGDDLPETSEDDGPRVTRRGVPAAASSARVSRLSQGSSSQRLARETPIVIDSDSDPAPRPRKPAVSNRQIVADGTWGNPIDRSAPPRTATPDEPQVEADVADGSWGHPINRSARPVAPDPTRRSESEPTQDIADGSWGHPIDRSASRVTRATKTALSPEPPVNNPMEAEPDIPMPPAEAAAPAGSWGHPIDRSQGFVPQQSSPKEPGTENAGASQNRSKKRASPPTPVGRQVNHRRAKGKARRLSLDMRHEVLSGPPSRLGPTWRTYSDTEPSGPSSPRKPAAQDELVASTGEIETPSGSDNALAPMGDAGPAAPSDIEIEGIPSEPPKEEIKPSTSGSSSVSAMLPAATSTSPLPQERDRSSLSLTVESTRVEVEQAVEEMRTGVEDVQLLPGTVNPASGVEDEPPSEEQGTRVTKEAEIQAPEITASGSDTTNGVASLPQTFQPREFKSFFGNQSSLDFVKNLMAKFTSPDLPGTADKPDAIASSIQSGERAPQEVEFQIVDSAMDVDQPLEVVAIKSEPGKISKMGDMKVEIISVHDSDSDSDRMEGPSSRPYGRTKRIASTPATSPTPPRIMSYEKWLEIVQNGGDSDISLSSDLLHPTFPDEVYPVEEFETEYPPGRRGVAIRTANTKIHEDWHKMEPQLTRMPELHREIFAGYITEATSIDEPQAAEIHVLNDVDEEGAPQDFEFAYSNRPLYAKAIPDPELTAGCGCDGPCDPHSKTCSCLKLQRCYSYDVGLDGFAYNSDGTLKDGLTNVSIWECGPNCGCPPECTNRVIQRGRASTTEVDIFKTRNRGWGVKARSFIPRGTFLGIYSGEIITEGECERRGKLYGDIGRTYLFDCDGYQISNPPEGLAEIDQRLAALAAAARRRAVRMAINEDDNYSYSACSVDAFHYGNFTRFLNHRCDPNLTIAQAYAFDFHPERPLLVIFARRDIKRGEECCISYKGLPDEAVPEPVKKVVKRGIGRGRGKKGKSSTAVHVALNKTVRNRQAKDLCKCGAWNCDGQMFGVNSRDESSGSPDD